MGRLTEEQKQFYKDNGYIVLKDLVIPEDLEEISVEYDKLFLRKNQEKMESSWVGSDENDRQNNSMFTDYHYFSYEKDSMVAAFLHLDAANPENGGLFVYPGSHKLGPQEDVGAKEGNFHYVDQ
ncbi:putative alpha-ketoglutarate-dependent hypophosphite dioxygenase, partial [Operophtera brumata]